MSHHRTPHIFAYIVIALLNLTAFITLYNVRVFDDNRLTSWKWVFKHSDIPITLVFLILGILAAYACAKISLPRRYTAVFLFLASYTACVVFWSEPEVIVDASRYFTQAKHLAVYGTEYFFSGWGREIQAWTDLPLVPFLYGLIFRFFGENRVYVQIFTTSLFSLTVVLTYVIGRTLWNDSVGSLAGALLLGMPYMLTQVPLMLVDIPTMFFLTLSIASFIKAIENGRAYIVLASVSLFLAFFSKYSTWVMFTVMIVIAAVYLKNAGMSRWTLLQRISAVTYLAAIPVLVIVIFKFDVFSGQIELLFEYQRPALKGWSESFVSTFFYQVHPFITVAAVCSVVAALRKKDPRYLIICWFTIIVVALQIRRARYIMITFPAVALMASYGIHMIKSGQFRKFIVLCAVSSSLVLALSGYLPFLRSMSEANMMDAGRYLNSVGGDSVVVFTLPSEETVVNPAVAVPILDIFTDREIVYDYDRTLIPALETFRESSLRFTWTYENPRYYLPKERRDADRPPVAIISIGPVRTLPAHVEQEVEGYANVRTFESSPDIFRFTPLVTVYSP